MKALAEFSAPPPWFSALLSRYSRVAIAGGPRTGKTSLAATVSDRPVIATDDMMDLPWDLVPEALINKAASTGPCWVMEGVQVARALRAGLRPDVVLFLGKQHGPIAPRQVAMKRAVETVFSQWETRNGRVPVVKR